ncbi:MAG: prolipoprotein diacylglyceryl transferase [Clostridia bacterium]|nr:prolipoprotein diacylglyceryl transferase [Clostridia bacterium]
MKPVFTFFGISFASYGVMCALGVLCALVFSLIRVKRMHLRMEYAFVMFVFALALGLAGAFFTHMIVSYSLKDIISMLRRGAIFQEYSPGFVFYGGFVFGLSGAYLASRLLNFRMTDYAPAMLPSLPLAHAFGRVGCFLAGCCYGIRCKFGFVYPPGGSAPSYISLFPVQLSESALLLVICFLLCLYVKKGGKRALSMYVFLYAPVRFLLEFLRGDMHRGIFLSLSTAQWTSLILFILFLIPVKTLRRG